MTKLQRVLLFFLLFGTMLIFGLIENIKGVSYPLIKAEFNASWEQQGFMVSMLSMSYVGFSIIAGIFLGHFGIKPSFLFGFAALSTGLFSVFFMPSFFAASASLFMVFAGFGFFEVGINALASRVFTAKAALLMNMLHAFYGIGAIIGPKAAGLLANNDGFGWRYIYLLALPLALVLFIPAIFTKFPESHRSLRQKAAAAGKVLAKRKNFFDALQDPLVWLMSITLGLAVVIEMSSANWGGLYFQDVYGLDPRTSGAAFLSAFFMSFTVSRLTCGILVERIGYMRSLMGVAFIILAIFVTGFCLGAKGIYILPALGFFIALLWPTIMALAIGCFGEDAPVYSSAMIAIGGALNAGVQFLVGITNRSFGPAWGYRSSLGYTVLLICALIILSRKVKAKMGKPAAG
ncbi:MFS transporter [Spirochaetia bacterium]|nr:MFS transporter [Spirochaetia bacterium]